MIAYASRTGTRRNLAALRLHGWRLLVSAAGCLRSEGFPYALDNGAWSTYTKGQPWDERKFLRALSRLGAGADWTCIPDIVAGGLASLEMSLRWMRRVLDSSPRAMLAVQDGMTADDVRPWIGERVGIFVGGSDAWKLPKLEQWIDLAREKSCWLHVARINGKRKISQLSQAGITSFDGTSCSRFAVNTPKLTPATKQLSMFEVYHGEDDPVGPR